MKILINRYHPVSEDIALSIYHLGHDVTLSVNCNISDHYGNWKELLPKIQIDYPQLKVISLQLALVTLSQFDLVICDGVFDGDNLLMETAKKLQKPIANIQGYPYVPDEPAQNILSLGWFLPQIQYVQKYPNENAVKNGDWKNIAEKGHSEGKNICVFYPNFWKLKEFSLSHKQFYSRSGLVSGIHRYEECNKYCFDVFKIIQNCTYEDVVNLEGKSKEDVWMKLINSRASLMLKAFDQPGIFLLESMLLGCPVLTMKSYVLGSFNQDVLIHGYSGYIADDIYDLINAIKDQDYLMSDMQFGASRHVNLITDFDRQKNKLQKFLERCVQ